jgi:outer membrane lipoprotein carrier protein
MMRATDFPSTTSVKRGMRGDALAATLAIAAALVVTAAAQGEKLTPEQIAGKIQQRYDTIKDFEADFVQTYEGGVLRTKTTERGTLAIKKPGKMRWLYSGKERKEFVSDGQKIYSYLPADKQVIVGPLPAPDQTTPALFLAGRGNIARDFTATLAELPGVEGGLVGLKLVPKRTDPELDWLIVGVDPATYQIRHLVATDRQGGRSTFSFSNLKENRNLSDKLFAFQIPRGVDVITNGVPAK